MVDSQAGPELFSLFRDDPATITILTAGAVALFLRLENQNTNLGMQIKSVEKDLKKIDSKLSGLAGSLVGLFIGGFLVRAFMISTQTTGCQGCAFGAGALGASSADCGGDAPDASVAITHELLAGWRLS
jgi:hypothetical protein